MAEGTRRQGEKRGSHLRTRTGIDVESAGRFGSCHAGRRSDRSRCQSTPVSSGTSSSSELTARFVASAIPTTNFIAAASRMASGDSRNDKIRKFAEDLAKDQTAVANSLDAWVNVNGPVVTLRSPYTGKIGPGAAKLSAPQLLPPQRSNLQRLSASQGRDFDSLYVSTLTEALVQLQTLYRDFSLTDADPGLKAIAVRELPKVEQTISALDAL